MSNIGSSDSTSPIGKPQEIQGKELPGMRFGRHQYQKSVPIENKSVTINITMGAEARRRIEEQKYLKITPERVYSPLLNYVIGSLKGEKVQRSFIPIAVRFKVETTTDEKQKTSGLVSLIYGRALLAFKQKEFANLLLSYNETTMSTFVKRGFNQIAWQYYDPKNIVALDIMARRRMSPEAIFSGISDQKKMKETTDKVYKLANIDTGKVFAGLKAEDKEFIETIRAKAKHAWRLMRQEQFTGKKSIYKDEKVKMLFTAAGKTAKLWNLVKLNVLGPINRILPLHTVTWTAKYILTAAAMTVTFSAYSAAQLLGKIGSCAKKTLFPPREKTTENVIKTETYQL